MAELENQFIQLREEREYVHQPTRESRGFGTYNLIPLLMSPGSGTASAISELVEMLFPGLERSTLTQIIKNRFKPTNIYRLWGTEKERAESQRIINIGGVEFEQTERDGKENDYRMISFFKEWAVYIGILVMLAPFALQGELATAMAIYTMNFYDLLEKYTSEGVRAYHFQFHRKRVASGKNRFNPTEWRVLDSELVASKCFAHPTPRLTWSQNHKTTLPMSRRHYDTVSGENAQAGTNPYHDMGPVNSYGGPEQRGNFPRHLLGQTSLAAAAGRTTQACRNWNH